MSTSLSIDPRASRVALRQRLIVTGVGAIVLLAVPVLAWPQSSLQEKLNVIWHSQTSAPERPPATGAPAPAAQVTSGFENGFFIQSADGLNRVQIGLLVQFDGRFAIEDSNEAIINTFAFRRLRPYLRGRIGGRFEFFLNPDFAGGTLVVQDAYVDTRFTTAFRLRLGKAKTPYGHERLHSANSLLFIDRAAPTAVAPNRDLGIQVLGDLAEGIVSYAAGLLNGVPDGASADLDTNDGKDVVGRLVVRPFHRTPTEPLGGLGFALSGSTGKQSGSAALPSYRTVVAQQPFFAYSGATADGRRTRYSPYVFYYYKAFGGFSEFGRSVLPVRKDTIREEIGHEAWQVAASWVLTGEVATDAGVRPENPFDFGGGHWGAFQIAARYHELSVDRRAFDLGLPAAGSSRTAKAWTIGLTWYLTQNIKYVTNFERVVFNDDEDGARQPENILAFRAQLYF
jgi:phosphate-selective porin OprO and OprP